MWGCYEDLHEIVKEDEAFSIDLQLANYCKRESPSELLSIHQALLEETNTGTEETNINNGFFGEKLQWNSK